MREIREIKDFDANAYFMTEGTGRKLVHIKSKRHFFLQGEPAAEIFYIQSGRAKLTVVSKKGKEATITHLVAGDFLGEEALSTEHANRFLTATALTRFDALKFSRVEMIRVMKQDSFAAIFINLILKRTIRTKAEQIDRLFNRSERLLARLLLLKADFDKPVNRQCGLLLSRRSRCPSSSVLRDPASVSS